MSIRKDIILDQDEAWPVLVWLFVRYEQKALATIFSAEANPAASTPERQLELAEDFLGTARPFKEALESWVGLAGSTKVSNYINDMIMYMTTGICLAKDWRTVVKESEERRQNDKTIKDSWLCFFVAVVFESYEKNLFKERRRVESLQSNWFRNQMRLLNRGQKLVLKRQATTTALLKRKVIASIPTDEELSRMKKPPKL